MEIMVVVAVIGILATQASYQAFKQGKMARRVEVTLGLDAVRDTQRAYYLANGRFAATFEQLTFSIEGAQLLSPTHLDAGRYKYTIAQPWGEKSYYVVAIGDLDGDAFPDVHVLEAGRR
jgi:type II secretory pathway pseudopilin PulG